MTAIMLCHLGLALVGSEQPEAAGSLARQSLLLCREVPNEQVTMRGVKCLAQVATAQGDCRRMARLFGAVEARREQLESPVPAAEHAGYQVVASARAALAEVSFAAAWAEARAMAWEDAI